MVIVVRIKGSEISLARFSIAITPSCLADLATLTNNSRISCFEVTDLPKKIIFKSVGNFFISFIGKALNIAAAVPAKIIKNAAGLIRACGSAPLSAIPTPTETIPPIKPIIVDFSMISPS